MEKLHYSVIKYIPDEERMEPVNVGVIVQTGDDLKIKFDAHAVRRGDVDSEQFRKWRKFFEEESQSPGVKGFKPAKSSPHFFKYLESCMDSDFRISKPSEHFVKERKTLDEYTQFFFDRLVAHYRKVPEYSLLSKYSRREQSLNFFERGLSKAKPVVEDPIWLPYRSFKSSRSLVIERISSKDDPVKFSGEIQNLSYWVSALNKHRGIDFFLIQEQIDFNVAERFSKGFQMQAETLFKQLEDAGAIIANNETGVEQIVRAVDNKLPQLQPAS